ncbi:class V chitinase-like [Juglans regia]|uniref:Class V chitinase-like n=1 Tax=Juglans regia TaxID=51240 RepID=A0A6P9EH74_JUGRE|nr:class V chitinase-like [Juglans regia]
MTTVKQKNPSITTLLSIGGGNQDSMVLSLMANSSVGRKSFIDSSIKMARSYSFQGLDLSWVFPNTGSDMNNMALLLEEWRVSVESEAKGSSQPQLILTAVAGFSPVIKNVSYPVDSMQKNLNWINIVAQNYYNPSWENITGPRAALHDPASHINTADGIRAWIYRGLSANKLVLGLPFFGSGWTLQNSQNNGIGALVTGPATGRFFLEKGNIPYKNIKQLFIQRYRAAVKYNSIYVMNYCFNGSTWIGFDGVEAVETKVSYAKEMGLLGYHVLEVTDDDNWELSLSAGRN